MERHSFAMEIKKGKKNEYRQILGEIWPDLTAFLDQEKVHNFSIWNCDSLIFGYYETDENNEFSEEKKASIQALTSRIDHTFTWISTPGENMRLMYHNFGVVRENKELIRHRMFMTRLKPDCEEEYKARHDGLVAASAGGYIFGYDEIDTTMETEETPEAHEATVAWETRQLGIMDWITNDCDWLTGTVHSASVRLAWHIGK